MTRAGARRQPDERNPWAATVPDVVGAVVADARAKAHDHAVVLASDDEDGPPLAALTWPGRWIVTAQDPAPGTVCEAGHYARVQLREDGSAGVREPRRPDPVATSGFGDPPG